MRRDREPALSPSPAPAPAALVLALLSLAALPLLGASLVPCEAPAEAFSAEPRESKGDPAQAPSEQRTPRPRSLPRQFKGIVPEVGPKPMLKRAAA